MSHSGEPQRGPDDREGAPPRPERAAATPALRAPRVPGSEEPAGSTRDRLGIVLSGGGARAAYQVGLLRCLARRVPGLYFPIVTGVSAGAINAIYLAAHPGSLEDAAEGLTELWSHLETEDVFRTDSTSLAKHLFGWGARLISGGSGLAPRMRGLVDSEPLRELLYETLPTDASGAILGIERNLERGRLEAVALTTHIYTTGQTLTWVQGRGIEDWERPTRRSRKARLTIDHVLATASLPLLFPAVRIGDDWHGDGGMRMAAPLSPALHLGARRLLVVSTRYARSAREADEPETVGYPPPAQILGKMLNAVFIDVVDDDILRLERLNRLLEKLPPEEREGLEPVDILALRPSTDLGRLAADYEPRLPGPFRFLTRSLGTRETRSPDFLSLLMFQPDYLRRLIELGEADAEAQLERISEFLDGGREAERRERDVEVEA